MRLAAVHNPSAVLCVHCFTGGVLQYNLHRYCPLLQQLQQQAALTACCRLSGGDWEYHTGWKVLVKVSMACAKPTTEPCSCRGTCAG